MAGRKSLTPAEKHGPDFVGTTPAGEAQALETLLERQRDMVERFGDGLPWNLEHYEFAIGSDLTSTAETFLRAGRRLLVVRACCAHGEWGGMLQRLNLGADSALRMMAWARQMESVANPARVRDLQAAASTIGKMIELSQLPPEQFKELAELGQTGELDLDDVASMTRDELRAAVREARADVEAKNERIAKLSGDLEKEHEKLSKAQRKWKTASADDRQVMLEQAVVAAEEAIKAQLNHPKDGLRAVVTALAEHCGANELDCDAFLGDVFGRLLNAVRATRDDETIAEYGVSIPLVGDGDA